jgi:hypothetical protein
VRVGEPAADRYRVLRMKNVGGGRVINDDRLPQVATYLRQILEVVRTVFYGIRPNDSSSIP